jgi:hypothetical protein
VVIIIENKTNEKITIQNSSLITGKWNKDRNKDEQVATIDDLYASPNHLLQINSYGKDEFGREGTEGNFNIMNSENLIIRQVHFNVPGNSTTKKKSFDVTGNNNNYNVTWNSQDISDAKRLGTVTIIIQPFNGKKNLNLFFEEVN